MVFTTGALAVDAIQHYKGPNEGDDEEGEGSPVNEAAKICVQIKFPEKGTTGAQTYGEERWLSKTDHNIQEMIKAGGRPPTTGENAKTAPPSIKTKL